MKQQQRRVPEVPGGFNVLGVVFQGFIDPKTNQVVFSLSGVARGLEIYPQQASRILRSEAFKVLAGETFQPNKISTQINPNPISVITQTELTLLVKLASKKGYPVAESMQDAGFVSALQQCLDVKLNTRRNLDEYLDAGANLQKRLTKHQKRATQKDKRDYRKSYQDLKKTTFNNGYGVRRLCDINRSVSDLAVADADERRAKNKNWRDKCSADETAKIVVGNMVHKKAVLSDSSDFQESLEIVRSRTNQIIALMDAPL